MTSLHWAMVTVYLCIGLLVALGCVAMALDNKKRLNLRESITAVAIVFLWFPGLVIINAWSYFGERK